MLQIPSVTRNGRNFFECLSRPHFLLDSQDIWNASYLHSVKGRFINIFVKTQPAETKLNFFHFFRNGRNVKTRYFQSVFSSEIFLTRPNLIVATCLEKLFKPIETKIFKKYHIEKNWWTIKNLVFFSLKKVHFFGQLPSLSTNSHFGV